jgi:LacI family transcriptional regulator
MSLMKIDEIARKAKVSRSTVSRVLNNNPNVRSNTRRAVEQVIRELNYVPNAAARSLASKRAGVVGVLIHNIMQPYWAAMFSGIERELVRVGYGVLLANYRNVRSAHDYLGNYKKSLRNLLIQNVDGVIIALANDLGDEDVEMLEASGKPFVVIQNSAQNPAISSVNVDNVSLAYEATSYLIEKGHRSIWHAAGPVGSGIARDRYDGFIKAMHDHNLNIGEECIVNCGSLFDDGYWCMKRILNQSARPTAILFQNDVTAYGSILAAREEGVDIPGSISIVGIDHLSAMMDLASLLPDLTSMVLPVTDLGGNAARMIVEQIEDSAQASNIVLPCSLYEGSTVRPLTGCPS